MYNYSAAQHPWQPGRLISESISLMRIARNGAKSMGIYGKILNSLNTERYITATRLGEQLLFSEKTIRNYMRELNDFLRPYGACIETKHGKGYRLAIQDEQLFSSIYKDGVLKKGQSVPIGTEERVDFIIMYLLCHFNYVRIDELTDIMCISESTLMADLRRTRQYLKEYNVRLENSAKKGIRAAGTEFNLRAALVNYVMKRGMIGESEIFLAEKEKNQIFSVVIDSLSELDISMPEISMQNVVMHLYVAIKRIKSGRPIHMEAKTHEEIQTEFSQGAAAARHICKRLETIFPIHFSQDELDYVTLYLSGNRVIGSIHKDSDNIIISPGIQDLAERMLQYIYSTMRIDFRNNFPLIMTLAQHLTALEIRVKYNIRLNNPHLEEIKKQYSNAYLIALQASAILENHYHKKLGKDEIGYLAVIFNLHLENMKDRAQETDKKNILIICAMGKASAQMLAYQYRKIFGQYLNRVEISNRSNIKNVDLSGIDYILTTTPISLKVPIPVIEIPMFLDDDEVSRLQRQFMQGGAPVKEGYFCEELFFCEQSFPSKEAVIRFLCNEIAEWRVLPDNFYESILLRESYGATDFGETVAMPHPYGLVTEESFVSVCVLEEPVYWNSHPVQVIILISLSDEKEGNWDSFFELLSEFIMNKKKVRELIAEPSYRKFIELLGLV